MRNVEGKRRVTYGIETDTHIVPEKITTAINLKIRAEKETEVDLCAQLKEKARWEMPDASDSKLNAIVYRQLQDIKHGKKEEHDPELTFAPCLLYTSPSPRDRG